MYRSPAYNASAYLGYEPNAGPAVIGETPFNPQSRYGGSPSMAPSQPGPLPSMPAMSPASRFPSPQVWRGKRDRPGIGGGVAQPDGNGGWKPMPGNLQYGGPKVGWTNTAPTGPDPALGASGHVNDASAIGGSSNPYGGALDSYANNSSVPSMAYGGIVNPQPGGVYRVAEAGYPEAVIPLHPRLRRRAIETLNQAANVIGVQPSSPSMPNGSSLQDNSPAPYIPAQYRYSNQGLASRSWRDNPDLGGGVQQTGPDAPQMPWMNQPAPNMSPASRMPSAAPGGYGNQTAPQPGPFSGRPTPAPGPLPSVGGGMNNVTYGRLKDDLAMKERALREAEAAEKGAGTMEDQQRFSGATATARSEVEAARGRLAPATQPSAPSAPFQGNAPVLSNSGSSPSAHPYVSSGAPSYPYQTAPLQPLSGSPSEYAMLPNGNYKHRDTGYIYQRGADGSFRELKEQRPVDRSDPEAQDHIRQMYESGRKGAVRQNTELDRTQTATPKDYAELARLMAEDDASGGGATSRNAVYKGKQMTGDVAGMTAMRGQENQRQTDAASRRDRINELHTLIANGSPAAKRDRASTMVRNNNAVDTIDGRLNQFDQGNYDLSQEPPPPQRRGDGSIIGGSADQDDAYRDSQSAGTRRVPSRVVAGPTTQPSTRPAARALPAPAQQLPSHAVDSASKLGGKMQPDGSMLYRGKRWTFQQSADGRADGWKAAG